RRIEKMRAAGVCPPAAFLPARDGSPIKMPTDDSEFATPRQPKREELRTTERPLPLFLKVNVCGHLDGPGAGNRADDDFGPYRQFLVGGDRGKLDHLVLDLDVDSAAAGFSRRDGLQHLSSLADGSVSRKFLFRTLVFQRPDQKQDKSPEEQ